MLEETRKRRSARRPRKRLLREKPPLRESRRGDEMQEYSLADLKRLFGLPPALIRTLSEAGFISQPASRGKGKYTFQDLLVLRVAGALKAAKISTPKIATALEQIRSVLPSGRLAVTLAASGKDLAVREGAREWEASGQFALPLVTHAAPREVAELHRPPEVS